MIVSAETTTIDSVIARMGIETADDCHEISMINHTHSTAAALEDAIAVLIDILIEDGIHRDYQARILSGLRDADRGRVAGLIEESRQHSRYLSERARTALAILEEARPSPYAYNPNRPAARVEPRPLSMPVLEEL